MIFGEMEPLETIAKRMRFGMSYINIIILDAGLGMHIASYDDKTKTYKNFHTQQEINNPVMWCELPKFNEGVFDALVEQN
jgi:hypothetical protein